jgi:hypothetical protein
MGIHGSHDFFKADILKSSAFYVKVFTMDGLYRKSHVAYLNYLLDILPVVCSRVRDKLNIVKDDVLSKIAHVLKESEHFMVVSR